MKNKTNPVEKHRKNIEEKFSALLRNISLSTDMEREVIFGNHGYGHNEAYLGTENKFYDDLAKAIRQAFPTISSDFLLRVLLHSTIIDLFDKYVSDQSIAAEADIQYDTILDKLDENDVAQFFEELYANAQEIITSKTIIIPMMGVKVVDSSDISEVVKIGECTLHHNSNAVLSTMLKSALSDLNMGDLKIIEKADCLLTVSVGGDFNFATEQAIQKASNVVHILNFNLASSFTRSQSYRKINLVGSPSKADDRLILSVTEDGKNRLGSWWTGNDLLVHEISGFHIMEWRKHQFERILSHFGKDFKSSSIEARIQRAIIWYSKAVNSDGIEEQFIGLTTAVEGLLVGKDEGNSTASTAGISQRLAERTAFLLGKNYAERLEYLKTVKELYGFRSKIVHEGKTVSIENLHRWNKIVRLVIEVFISHNFVSWDQFTEWENIQKFTPIP